MKILNGKITENEISFTVVDGNHQQTFKHSIYGTNYPPGLVLDNISKGLVEIGRVLSEQVEKGVADVFETPVPGQKEMKKIESFGVDKYESLLWKERGKLYEWYKIYHNVGFKKKETHHAVYDGLLTEDEAEKRFNKDGTVWGKTGRFYEPSTKTFHCLDTSPKIKRI